MDPICDKLGSWVGTIKTIKILLLASQSRNTSAKATAGRLAKFSSGLAQDSPVTSGKGHRGKNQSSGKEQEGLQPRYGVTAWPRGQTCWGSPTGEAGYGASSAPFAPGLCPLPNLPPPAVPTGYQEL